MGGSFPRFSKTRHSGSQNPDTRGLRQPQGDWARLLIGLGASLALHAAAVAAIVASSHAHSPGQTASSARQAVDESDPDRPDPDEVKLGVDRSSAVTLTWIGFEEATPHQAMRSEVDQAAVAELEGERTLQPGDPGEPAEPSPDARPAEQDLDAPADPSEVASTAIEEAFDPAEAPPETPDTTETTEETDAQPDETTIQIEESDFEDPAEGSTLPVEVGPTPDAAPGPLEIVDNRLEPPAPALPMPEEAEPDDPDAPDETASAEEAEEPDQAEPGEEAPTGSRGEGGGAEGRTTDDNRIPSDREADAAAKEEPHEVRPGQPLAAEGLRVQTRGRPDFSVITRLTGARRTPVYGITFGRDGRVRNVEIIESSGNPNVDEPWRNVLYRWTATGERLEQLSEDDPEAGVTIKIRLLAPQGRY